MEKINNSKELLEEVQRTINSLEAIRNSLEEPCVSNDKFEEFKLRFYELVNYPNKD